MVASRSRALGAALHASAVFPMRLVHIEITFALLDHLSLQIHIYPQELMNVIILLALLRTLLWLALLPRTDLVCYAAPAPAHVESHHVIQRKQDIHSSLAPPDIRESNASMATSVAELPNPRKETFRRTLTTTLIIHKNISYSFHVRIDQLHTFARIPTPGLDKVIERCYESIALCLVGLDLMEQRDLDIHIGDLTLAFHIAAGHLSYVALSAVLRHLGQILQWGLTGFVSGEVVDVRKECKILFFLDVKMQNQR